MSEKRNIYNREHKASLTESFNEFYNKEQCIDLVFICSQGLHVKTHKPLLVTRSNFIKKLLLQTDEKITFITLPDIEVKYMKLALGIIYGGGVRVNYENYRKILEIVRLLQIDIDLNDSGFKTNACDVHKNEKGKHYLAQLSESLTTNGKNSLGFSVEAKDVVKVKKEEEKSENLKIKKEADRNIEKHNVKKEKERQNETKDVLKVKKEEDQNFRIENLKVKKEADKNIKKGVNENQGRQNDVSQTKSPAPCDNAPSLNFPNVIKVEKEIIIRVKEESRNNISCEVVNPEEECSDNDIIDEDPISNRPSHDDIVQAPGVAVVCTPGPSNSSLSVNTISNSVKTETGLVTTVKKEAESEEIDIEDAEIEVVTTVNGKEKIVIDLSDEHDSTPCNDTPKINVSNVKIENNLVTKVKKEIRESEKVRSYDSYGINTITKDIISREQPSSSKFDIVPDITVVYDYASISRGLTPSTATNLVKTESSLVTTVKKEAKSEEILDTGFEDAEIEEIITENSKEDNVIGLNPSNIKFDENLVMKLVKKEAPVNIKHETIRPEEPNGTKVIAKGFENREQPSLDEDVIVLTSDIAVIHNYASSTNTHKNLIKNESNLVATVKEEIDDEVILIEERTASEEENTANVSLMKSAAPSDGGLKLNLSDVKIEESLVIRVKREASSTECTETNYAINGDFITGRHSSDEVEIVENPDVSLMNRAAPCDSGPNLNFSKVKIENTLVTRVKREVRSAESNETNYIINEDIIRKQTSTDDVDIVKAPGTSSRIDVPAPNNEVVLDLFPNVFKTETNLSPIVVKEEVLDKEILQEMNDDIEIQETTVENEETSSGNEGVNISTSKIDDPASNKEVVLNLFPNVFKTETKLNTIVVKEEVPDDGTLHETNDDDGVIPETTRENQENISKNEGIDIDSASSFNSENINKSTKSSRKLSKAKASNFSGEKLPETVTPDVNNLEENKRCEMKYSNGRKRKSNLVRDSFEERTSNYAPKEMRRSTVRDTMASKSIWKKQETSVNQQSIYTGNRICSAKDMFIIKHEKDIYSVLTEWHIRFLEKEYKRDHRPDKLLIYQLAEEMKIPAHIVKAWFIHRRGKGSVSNVSVDSRKTHKEVKTAVSDTMLKGTSDTFTNKDETGKRLTQNQKEVLIQEFQITLYPTHERYLELSSELNLPLKRIKKWFEKERGKYRNTIANKEVDSEPIIGTTDNQIKIEDFKSEIKLEETEIMYQEWQNSFLDEINLKDSISEQVPEELKISEEYKLSEELKLSKELKLSEELKISKNTVSKQHNADNIQDDELCNKNNKKDQVTKAKKKPFKFSKEQVAELNRIYESDHRPSAEMWEKLQKKLGIPRHVLKNWFYNKHKRKVSIKKKISLKREPFSLTVEQLKQMKRAFKKNKIPSVETQKMLEKKFGIPVWVTKKWFQNRRYRQRDDKHRTLEKIACESTATENDKLSSEELLKNKNVTTEDNKKTKDTCLIKDEQDIYSVLTEWHIRFLEKEYKRDHRPDKLLIYQLAEEMEIPAHIVKAWFIHKRGKGLPNWFIHKRGKDGAVRLLTQNQKEVLLNEFQMTLYPTPERYLELSLELNLPLKRIKKWFAKERWKYRNEICGKEVKSEPSTNIPDNSLNSQIKQEDYRSEIKLEEIETEYQECQSGFLGNVDLKKSISDFLFSKQVSEEPEMSEELKMSTNDEEKCHISHQQNDNNKQEPKIKNEELKCENNEKKLDGEKRKPFKFTEKQLRELKKIYEKNHHPSADMREKLQKKLGIPTHVLKNWFHNRRRVNDKMIKIEVVKEEVDLKKKRFSFTEEQLREMKRAFKRSKIPSEKTLVMLGKKFRIPIRITKKWFENRRYRQRDDIPGDEVKAINDVTDVAEKDVKLPSEEMLENQNVTPEENVKNEDAPEVVYNPWMLTEWHINFLEKEYKLDRRPDEIVIKQLSEESGLPVGLIHNWFVNRRRKGSVKKSKPNGDASDKIISETLSEEPSQSQNMTGVDQEKDSVLVIDSAVQEATNSNIVIQDNKKDKPIALTKSQLKMLQNAYKKEKYPDYASKKKLAEKLKLTWKRVNNWYRNRRKRETQAAITEKRGSDNNDAHINLMESHYQECTIPTNEVITNLASTLKLEKKLIYDWFKSSQEEKHKVARHRKKRFRFDETQVCTMEKYYQENKYPPADVITNLVEIFKVERRVVVNWFAHRREKDKRAQSSSSKGNIAVNVGTADQNHELQSTCPESNKDDVNMEYSTTKNSLLSNDMKQKLADLVTGGKMDDEISVNSCFEDLNCNDLTFNAKLNSSSVDVEIESDSQMLRCAANEKDYIDLEIKKEIMEILTETVEDKQELESFHFDVNETDTTYDTKFII